MAKPVFPKSPFDGQVYTDQSGMQWIYDVKQDSWSWTAPALNLPVAKSGNQCEGAN
jgi:hypothetical protein